MQILKNTSINWRERILIVKLYMDQCVEVLLDQQVTRSVKTGRGVKKGCCLSPLLLNVYGKYFTKDDLEGFDVFRRIRQVICSVIYADDLVLLAKEEIFIVT